jgi:hypothetical protein
MRAARVLLFLNAGFYGFAGLALLFLPQWFYVQFANFPPFHRHFMGDIGAFGLGLAGLFLGAALTPPTHTWALCCAALVGFTHGANHVFDCFLGGCTVQHFALDSLPHLLLGGSSLWVGLLHWRTT